MQKEQWQNVGYFQSNVKKSYFDPPFWIEPPFLTQYSLYSCCWQKKTHCKKQNAKILENAQDVLWISAAILDIWRHLESDKKLFSCEICPMKIQAQIIKTQKCLNVFQSFWKSPSYWPCLIRDSNPRLWIFKSVLLPTEPFRSAF
jgi:hypothetical protein